MSKVFAVFAVLSGLTWTLPAAAQPVAPAERQCFSQRDIQNVAAQDDYTINLRIGRTGRGVVYQAKTAINCPNIGLGPAVGYRSFTSQICSATDMAFITAGPFSTRECPLASLRRLSPAEAAALPRRGRP